MCSTQNNYTAVSHNEELILTSNSQYLKDTCGCKILSNLKRPFLSTYRLKKIIPFSCGLTFLWINYKTYKSSEGNLINIPINRIARLYTEHIQSYSCLNDKV